ncbi:MAG: FG-GAP-like repeat-containing protein [Planctomycetota bacterium]
MSVPVQVAVRHARRATAIAIVVALYFQARLPAPSAGERAEMAGRFRFQHDDILSPSVRQPAAARPVHPSLEHIAGWINTLGAGIALEDLDNDGLPNDLAWVDPRFDQVFVGPAPRTGERYASFALDLASLGHDAQTIAPMGCLPCDVNEDGLADLLVYFWGRPPVAFVCREDPPTDRSLSLRADSYLAEPIGDPSERWYTNAAALADVDGDGHADLVIGNYFPDGARILDASASGTEELHDSMSRAFNGGRNRLLLWAESGFVETEWGLPDDVVRAWTLAVGARDLDGDLNPEIYFANDFGPDRLLHNRSSAGKPSFAVLEGVKTFTMPNSKVLGRDSFKGMGVDFGDLNGDGLQDLVVSNITTEFGLEESQFAWVSTGETERMRAGVAPYLDESESLGLSRSGWAWDCKLADFDADGVLEMLQALGFMKGEIDRWPELHEVAMGNDALLRFPGSWHTFLPGDDLGGRSPNAFFARSRSGRYFDLARELGFDRPQNTRGIAIADVDGDGDLDLAFGNQWEPSTFHTNVSERRGTFLGLHLVLPIDREPSQATSVRAGHPGPELRVRSAIGAVARAKLPDGRILAGEVDGGGGHSGKRSQDLHFGLGSMRSDSNIEVELAWRDRRGRARRESIEVSPGWHTVILETDGDPR